MERSELPQVHCIYTGTMLVVGWVKHTFSAQLLRELRLVLCNLHHASLKRLCPQRLLFKPVPSEREYISLPQKESLVAKPTHKCLFNSFIVKKVTHQTSDLIRTVFSFSEI